jgi:hypothetical protein
VSDNLPDDPEKLKAMLLAALHESERLRQIIKEMQRHRFGRKAETLPEEQMLLGLEDVQQVAASAEAGQDETVPEGRAERARKRRNNRGALPAHAADRGRRHRSTPAVGLPNARPQGRGLRTALTQDMGAADIVVQCVGRSTAARATDGVVEDPPFALAAERWALK